MCLLPFFILHQSFFAMLAGCASLGHAKVSLLGGSSLNWLVLIMIAVSFPVNSLSSTLVYDLKYE